jgi:hypothetical protein
MSSLNTLPQIAQQVQSMASAIEGSLSELVIPARQALQSVISALVGGAPQVPETALMVGADIGLDAATQGLDSPFNNLSSETLQTFRDEFKQGLSHAAEIHSEQRERERRDLSLFGELVMPPARAELDHTKHAPLIKL